jgi:carbon-monoxide dehydrogenase medium subunit
MNDFQYHTPHSLAEAFALLRDFGDDIRIIAGGTALVLFMKQRLAQPGHLLSLQKIPALDGIAATRAGIQLGAMCTHRKVETSPLLQETVPLLCETYRHVATVRIRNMATVGGGLVHADPNLDPPPSLIALDAQVVLTSASAQRTLPVEEFFLDYYETVIQPWEVLTQVLVPPLPPNSGTAYFKFLPRTADDYATVSAAVRLTLGRDGGVCEDVRIGLGSLGTTPIRARQAEAVLRGRRITPDLMRQAGEAAQGEVDPLDDFRGSADYKRQMAGVFTRRALERALANIQGVPS